MRWKKADKLGIHLGSEEVATEVFPDPKYKDAIQAIVGSTNNVAARYMKNFWDAYHYGSFEQSGFLAEGLRQAHPFLHDSGTLTIPRLTAYLTTQNIGSGCNPLCDVSDNHGAERVGQALVLLYSHLD
jgi:hypothetical protein